MMKRFLAVVVLGVTGAVGAQQAKVAQTPPMGWNSWDSWGLTITEPEYRANTEVLKNKLLPYGWNYSVIDEGWYFENPKLRETPDKLEYAMDAYGRYVPVPARFPSSVRKGAAAPKASPAGAGIKMPATIEDTGFEALAAWVHSQGLKFGIHIIRGIPKAGVERNLPIADSNFHGEDAADKTNVCPWDPTSWGVKDNAAGQAWYDSLLKQYAGWGIDFIKVDCIADHPYRVSEIRQIRKAIDKTGRPMVLSLSPGPTNLSHAVEVGELANMWRISNDEWDLWHHVEPKDDDFPQGVLDQFERLGAWAKYTKPGAWPDADMLAIGELRPFPGILAPRTTRLTPDEQKTLLSMWSMARSPLILGANLTLLDAPTLEMLTNRDLIAIDQTSVGSFEAKHDGSTIVWRSTLRGGLKNGLKDGSEAVAVFNIGETPLEYKAAFTDIDPKLGGKTWMVHDVWAKKDIGTRREVAVTLAPHASAVFLLR